MKINYLQLICIDVLNIIFENIFQTNCYSFDFKIISILSRTNKFIKKFFFNSKCLLIQ